MKHDISFDAKHFSILKRLSSLPRNIVALHGIENLTEFVFDQLCDSNCFDLDKALFLVDNPDFNCLKGIVGRDRSQAHELKDIWTNQEMFSRHMSGAPFNNKVRSLLQESSKNSKKSDDLVATMVAKDFGIKNIAYCSWDMKHDNHGLFIYEKPEHYELDQECLLNGVSLFSLCPIF